MKGAREYVQYLESGVFGRLRVVVGAHGRGKTLRVYVLPEPGSSDSTVEVYGVVAGNPGWTEEYGWLFDGPWVADFDKLVAAGRARAEELEVAAQAAANAKFIAECEARQKVLDSYVTLDELGAKADAAHDTTQDIANTSEGANK